MLPRRLVLAFFIIGSFVGIWHALPMLNVILDEQYFVGSVLRAIEMKSFLPIPGDVPYGTLTFYLNYALQIPFLLILLAWKGFSIASLKTYLVLHPEIAYIVPRFLSAALASLIAVLYERYLFSIGLSLAHRFAVLSVIFCTIIATLTLHTGKMWVLSMVLVTASALLLYIALAKRDERASFWSVVLSFAAFANFPFNGVFLINVPILLYTYRTDKNQSRKICKGIAMGSLVLLAVLAANFQTIYALIIQMLFPTSTAAPPSFFSSLFFHSEQILIAFPLVLIVLGLALLVRAVENKLLFFLSLGYAALYLVTISAVVKWFTEMGAQLHYLYPLAFFFSGTIAAIRYQRMRHLLWVFCVLQSGIFIYSLYLLSVPTTFNQAASFIEKNLKSEHTLLVNDVTELTLPLNKETSLLLKDELCASKCLYWREAAHDADFTPVVVTSQSETRNVEISQYSHIFLITDQKRGESCLLDPMATFQGGASDTGYVNAEYNFGHYFHTDFWHLSRLGKNFRIYEISKKCAAEVLSHTE